jgi:hypothetical protein
LVSKSGSFWAEIAYSGVPTLALKLLANDASVVAQLA